MPSDLFPQPVGHPAVAAPRAARVLAALQTVAASAALQLLRVGNCWGDAAGQPVQPTGFAALDAELPGGGWPAAGLTELLLREPGSGELRLLAPALRAWPARAGAGPAARGEILWVAPPLLPYAPALQSLGLLDRLTVVTAASAADAAWAVEQALRSGVCATVLWWTPTTPTSLTTLRRLHLAAQEGACALFALRPWSAQQPSSPAPLRLTIEVVAPATLALRVFKRRGPAMVVPLALNLPAVGRLRSARRTGMLPPAPTGQRLVMPTADTATAAVDLVGPESCDAVAGAAPAHLAA